MPRLAQNLAGRQALSDFLVSKGEATDGSPWTNEYAVFVEWVVECFFEGTPLISHSFVPGTSMILHVREIVDSGTTPCCCPVPLLVERG